MPNYTLTLTTPRDMQARSLQAARVAAVVLDLGELELLDMTIQPGSDMTTSNAVSVVRSLVLVPGPTFDQILTTPGMITDTLRSLFDGVLGQTCACSVTPTVT